MGRGSLGGAGQRRASEVVAEQARTALTPASSPPRLAPHQERLLLHLKPNLRGGAAAGCAPVDARAAARARVPPPPRALLLLLAGLAAGKGERALLWWWSCVGRLGGAAARATGLRSPPARPLTLHHRPLPPAGHGSCGGDRGGGWCAGRPAPGCRPLGRPVCHLHHLCAAVGGRVAGAGSPSSASAPPPRLTHAPNPPRKRAQATPPPPTSTSAPMPTARAPPASSPRSPSSSSTARRGGGLPPSFHASRSRHSWPCWARCGEAFGARRARRRWVLDAAAAPLTVHPPPLWLLQVDWRCHHRHCLRHRGHI